MIDNKNGFELGTSFNMGGVAWTVIQTDENWVKCISSEIVEHRAFDEENKNDFSVSSIRKYLNYDFLKELIQAGVPEEIFLPFYINLTADDGLKDYGSACVRMGLITCDEYRALRKNIPAVDDWWWTATPDSTIDYSCVRGVYSDGTLDYSDTNNGNYGVRPICVLKSEILRDYLDGSTIGYNKLIEQFRLDCEKLKMSLEQVLAITEKLEHNNKGE